MVVKVPHAADKYDEGLQRTPELEISMVTTAVWQVHSNSSYRQSSNSNKQSKCHTKQATQQANHVDDSRNTDDEAEAATNGCCCCCCCGGESALATSERAPNGKRDTGGNGYV